MNDIEILGNLEKGVNFIKKTEKKEFLFSLIISYTATCEIPGITIAGANPNLLKYTAAADAEFLHYGFCKSIDAVPMTPDGKPTPAILTKTALEAASIPSLVINAGSRITPQLPFLELGLVPGKNILEEPGMDPELVRRAIEYGRIAGRTLASSTDCLVIGESIPGGTTTALGVMAGLGMHATVSSSMPENPIRLKNQIVQSALKRIGSKDPFEVVAQLGDPMIPAAAGILSTASESTNVILAGGTQMVAVLAFAQSTGFNKENVAIGTTSYIIEDKDANLVDLVKQVSDIPILAAKLKLGNSKISGLRSYASGFVKEGTGAGGSSVACMLKTGIDSEKLLLLTEREYDKIISR